MMNPKISVIVPVYKAEKFMCRCIDSILAQTLEDIELIIIDDGSPDQSGAIADQYASKDSRVRVIHQCNTGPSASRNVGIMHAKGQYIGFVDADDWVDKEMYSSLYSVARRINADIAVCDFILEFPDPAFNQKRVNPREQKFYLRSEEIKSLVFSEYAENDGIYFCPLWNKLYRRKLLRDKKLFIDEKYDHSEDWLFNLKCLSTAETLAYTSLILYHYIQFNASSLTKKYRTNQFQIYLELREALLKAFEDHNIDKGLYKHQMDNSLCYKAIMCVYAEIKSCQPLSYKIRNIRKITKHPQLQDAVANFNFKGNPLYFNILMELIKRKMDILLFGIVGTRDMFSNGVRMLVRHTVQP